MFLNVLKIVGLAIGSISGVIATLKETKTPDKKHLTPAGRALLVLGILGFLLALGAQLGEWQEAETAEQSSRERTERLLTEIRRAVTKFDTISVDISYRLPLDQPEFATYRERLDATIKQANDEYVNAGKTIGGLRVLTRGSEVSVLGLSDPSGLPGAADGHAQEFYSRAPFPEVALFKKPFDATTFSVGQNPTKADLVLYLKEGNEQLLITPGNEAQPTVASYKRFGMQASVARFPPPSGEVTSIEDLSECDAVFYMPLGTSESVQRLWAATYPNFVFYFNLQRLQVGNPRLVQVRDGQIYVYRFPKTFPR
jgi:hypothetical protein